MRLERHKKLEGALAAMKDRDLAALLQATQPTEGWGSNRVLEVAGEKVFSKSVPVTQEEYQRPYETANLFELPTFYNYGVGSAGFGAFREVAAHAKTTGWVLEGAGANFPLMYHHRVLPRLSKREGMDEEKLAEYVRYWNGSAEVGRYIGARMEAEYELVFFLEFIPQVLAEWLPENLDRWPELETQMLGTFDFLREQEFVHFDAHAYNLLTDGKHCYLADFGLALDASFDLSAEEKAFLDCHKHFDAAEFVGCLMGALFQTRAEWTPERRELLSARFGGSSTEILMKHLDQLPHRDNDHLPKVFVDGLKKYAALNNYMDTFFRSMKSQFKDAKYDDGWVADKLAEARQFEER